MSSLSVWRLATMVVLATVVFGDAALAQRGVGMVTLAWDKNPEPEVSGYFVYVSRSGSTAARLDAGPATRFTYVGVVPGVGYTFTVAAYTEDGTVGPQSESVFYLGGASLETARIDMLPLAATSAPALDATASTHVSATSRLTASANVAGATVTSLCTVDQSACYHARPMLTLDEGEITALAPLPDGRVALVQNRRTLLIVDESGRRVPALTVSESHEIVSIAVDPAFAETRSLVMAIAEPDDAGRLVSLVRYREIGGTLAQAATLVADLPVPAIGSTPLTVDAQRRLYLAVPAGAAYSGSGAAYAAHVLRFDADGRASAGNANASPLFAPGYAKPSAMFWDAHDNALWVSGRGPDLTSALKRVVLDTTRTTARLDAGADALGHVDVVFSAMAGDPAGETMLAVETATGTLSQVTATGRAGDIRLPHGTQATLVAGQIGTGTFLVVRDSAGTAQTLLRLSLEP